MFYDSNAWPPPPDGYEPPRPPARLSRPQERVMLTTVGMFLLVMFLGPLAGSSVVLALLALFF
jgi:hypothetical protein